MLKSVEMAINSKHDKKSEAQSRAENVVAPGEVVKTKYIKEDANLRLLYELET